MTVDEWRVENGIPDWTSHQSYPKGLSRDQIKWEFLRRDYYYKLRWSEYEDEDGHALLSEEDRADIELNKKMAAIEYELPDLMNPRIQVDDLKKKIFIRQFQGVQVFDSMLGGQKLLLGDSQIKTTELIQDDRFAVFAFDLRYPLSYQIEKRAVPLLKKLQAALKRDRAVEVKDTDVVTRDYIKHLRTIDAYSERAKSVDIGHTVFGIKDDDKKARDRADYEYKRALQMWRYF